MSRVMRREAVSWSYVLCERCRCWNRTVCRPGCRDDKEEAGLAAVEIETKMVQQPPPAVKPPPLQPMLPAPPPPPPAPARAQAAMPLVSGGSSSSGSRERNGPFLEASVVRVVGCDMLNPAATKQYYLVMYPSSKTGGWGREGKGLLPQGMQQGAQGKPALCSGGT